MSDNKKILGKEAIPYIEIHDVRTPFIKKSTINRRDFFRTLFSVTAVTGLAVSGVRWKISKEKPGQKIQVTDNCVGCTGCIVICPTSAIRVVGGGIAVSEDDCVSCGYCQAGCAVDGIRVLQENWNHA